MRCFRTLAALGLVATVATSGCRSSSATEGPPVPASSDPEGKDLVPGAIVAAVEKTGGVRLYKVVDSLYFPPPMTDELVMIGYAEKSDDFARASALWASGKLTVALGQVRVQRHMFRTRDYRVLANVPVTDADRSAKPPEPERK